MLTVQGIRRPESLMFTYFLSNPAETWVVTSTSKQVVEASEVSLAGGEGKPAQRAGSQDC